MRALAVLTLLLVLLSGSSSVSAATPSKIVTAAVSNAASSILKRLWSLKSTTKTAIPSHRPSMKFESGYTVDTVFDGSKLGIEPYSVEVTQSGELLLLDSVNSNVYRISLPLSRYSRPKLVAGSPEGYVGYVDGRPREARLNHPKGITVDERGNIYVADTMNMAIRKISDTGVTTIAGGKWSRGAHSDGASEDAKFSTDFEVVYLASSCSLLVVDRGHQAIREIQLNVDDCAYQYETGFPLGIAVLLAAGFFGYMLALLQRRVGLMISSKEDLVQEHRTNFIHEHQTPLKTIVPPYQRQMASVRPPLMPTGEDAENAHDEGLFTSSWKLISRTWLSSVEIFVSMFPIFRKKPKPTQYLQQQQRVNTWSMPESFVIPDDEIPPPVEARAPTPRKTYAFMSKEPEKIHHIGHPRTRTNGWNTEPRQQVQQVHKQQQLQQHQQYSSRPQTYYEQSCETTNEIVFGAVQELDSKCRSVEIKAVNYGDPIYEQFGMRYRNGYMWYGNY
ncbi:uncharacterized protein LOC122030137 isoform X1 [Zingiber officinale]|uniref:uncharacterized protein LOC122030137 isoform X1 n=1 Tax=Zingiber officinale TaxID=94328 RepID=UPI001C4A8536|nr:uncharacterized protein LOC122030137 isoform X1 [Zingiber officinale]